MKAVILTPSEGIVLEPYRLPVPKPMMPLGERSVIERVLPWLERNGVDQIMVLPGQYSQVLRTVCGDGMRWGLGIEYLEGGESLGALETLHSLRDWLDGPFLVLGGDSIADLDLRELMRFHQAHDGALTVAVKDKVLPAHRGVLTFDAAGLVTNFEAEPTEAYSANMGVYCMDPSILEWIPRDVQVGFNDLMSRMLEKGKPARVFRHPGQFLDIEIPADFLRAQELAEHGRLPI